MDSEEGAVQRQRLQGSQRRRGDRLSSLGGDSCLELKSRRGKEMRTDSARSGLVDVNRGWPSHLIALVSFGNRTGHLWEGWGDGRCCSIIRS